MMFFYDVMKGDVFGLGGSGYCPERFDEVEEEEYQISYLVTTHTHSKLGDGDWNCLPCSCHFCFQASRVMEMRRGRRGGGSRVVRPGEQSS